jgi:hypothetical protein
MKALSPLLLVLLTAAAGCAGAARLPADSGMTEIAFDCSGRICQARIDNPSHATGTAIVTTVRNRAFSSTTFSSVTHVDEQNSERRLPGGLGVGGRSDTFSGMTVGGTWRVELAQEPPAMERVVLEVEWRVE